MEYDHREQPLSALEQWLLALAMLAITLLLASSNSLLALAFPR